MDAGADEDERARGARGEGPGPGARGRRRVDAGSRSGRGRGRIGRGGVKNGRVGGGITRARGSSPPTRRAAPAFCRPDMCARRTRQHPETVAPTPSASLGSAAVATVNPPHPAARKSIT